MNQHTDRQATAGAKMRDLNGNVQQMLQDSGYCLDAPQIYPCGSMLKYEHNEQSVVAESWTFR